MIQVKRALVSVSDKTGLVEFAKGLSEFGVELISTGGTYKTLKEAGIAVKYISEVTGFPEILDGRVKTLHPNIHGGILAMRGNEKHMAQLAEQGIGMIDMVVVNLYPFVKTISNPDVTLEDAIENIDIGGPTMVRSSAKNFAGVAIVVNPADYDGILAEMKENSGQVSRETRFKLSLSAFRHTAEYDMAIATYLGGLNAPADGYPEKLYLKYEKAQELRYGENPHQGAAFYREAKALEPSVSNAKQLHGKELSFNNIIDTNAAFEIVKEFSEPAAVVIKHTNPCGSAVGKDIFEAYTRAHAADPVSAYGGIIGLNREVDGETAKEIAKVFTEVVIAPSFSAEALEVLTQKKNIRLLAVGELNGQRDKSEPDMKKVVGGLLLQDRDLADLDDAEIKIATKREPNEQEWKDLKFAWKVSKHIKSNAIFVAKDEQGVGVGAGQMSRIDSATIAVDKAGEKAKGGVVGSDAFFPFRDGIDQLAKAGITAIIQPGGSVRDAEVIEACDQHGIAMVFTGIRHFKH